MTFCDTGLLMAFVVVLIGWPQQLNCVSVVMMIGGELFFVMAVLLSIYRDRLVELPEKIRSGRGLFRFLHWR
jgi:hypothetical protein